jgi:AAA15 family ATPase/GTPase
MEDYFFHIRLIKNSEPEITILLLKHHDSNYEFQFFEESDGTQRLFDLVDMILTQREDIVYVVDELERSLHPKVTEQFLTLFMQAHESNRAQLIFTTHENTIMNQNLFRRDEIWFVERSRENTSKIDSLDRFKERYDMKIDKAYLDGRYGAVPIFSRFTFDGKE